MALRVERPRLFGYHPAHSQAAAIRSSLLLFLRGAALAGPQQVHPKLLLSGPLFSCSWGEPRWLDLNKFIPSCWYQVLFFTPVLEGPPLTGPQQVYPKLLVTGLFSPVIEGSSAAWTLSCSSQAASIGSSFLLFLRGLALTGPQQVHPKLLLSGPFHFCSWWDPRCLDLNKIIPSCCYQVLFTPKVEGPLLTRPQQVRPKLLLSGSLYSCSCGKPCCLDLNKFIPSCCNQVLFTPVLEGTAAAWTPPIPFPSCCYQVFFTLVLEGSRAD